MQGPWSIFLIQSESEKVRSFLLLCIIYIHQIKVVFYIMACLSFPMFSNDAFGKRYNETGLSTCQASKMLVIDKQQWKKTFI